MRWLDARGPPSHAGEARGAPVERHRLHPPTRCRARWSFPAFGRGRARCGRRRGRRAGSAGRSSRTPASPSARTSRGGRRSPRARRARSRSWTSRSNGERNVDAARGTGAVVGVRDARRAGHARAARRARGSASRRTAASPRAHGDPSRVSGYQRRRDPRRAACRARPTTATSPRAFSTPSIRPILRSPHQRAPRAGRRVILDLAREQRPALLELAQDVAPERRVLLQVRDRAGGRCGRSLRRMRALSSGRSSIG